MNRHYKNSVQTEEFVNPYNFVPLTNACNKSVDVSMKDNNNDRLSGVINCTLETLTPLFIPNTTNDKAFPFPYTFKDKDGKKKTIMCKAYDFFSYNDLSHISDCTNHYSEPIIPGSSIRGAVRSAFEAVTNSCLSTCDDEDLILHRRTSKAKDKCGVLVKNGGGYDLYSAEKVMLNTSEYHNRNKKHGKNGPHPFGRLVKRSGNSILVDGISKMTGDVVYIQKTKSVFVTSPKGRDKKPHNTELYGVDAISVNKSNETPEEGILFLGEKFQSKHHDAVFIKKSITSHKVDFERFLKVWERYQADSKGRGVYPNYIKLKEIPVYYSIISDHGTDKLYIAPACISKEVFDAKLSVLLGSHKPCTTARDKICPACALFGLVSDDTDGALASRVMFHDAHAIDITEHNRHEYFVEPPRQLPILGSPKISATEFYTDDYTDKYRVWNYDYGTRKSDGQPEAFIPKLRGRKFYWHKKELTKCGHNDRADLTAKIRAIKSNKRFRFKISFDRITEKELGTLLWTLTFGDDNRHAHKLGHGKPIGYGSVRYTIENVRTYKLKNDLSFQISDDINTSNLYVKSGINKKDISQYLLLTDFANAPDNITYPIGEKDTGNKSTDKGVYQWFSMNKGNMNNPEFQQVLDTPEEIVKTSKPTQVNSNIAATAIIIESQKNHKTDTIGNKPMVAPPSDKKIKRAFQHFRNVVRNKRDDNEHILVLKSVPNNSPDFKEAQKILRDFETK